MKNLESKIKQKLSELNMTIQRLAIESGVSEPTIHAIFNRDDAKISQLVRISNALNASLSFFLEEVPDSTSTTTQSGTYNQAGNGNSQKIKVSKSPSQELAADLAACQRELALMKALVESKDETITLLRASYNRPN